MSKAADKIAEGLQEALAVAKGEAEPLKVHYQTWDRVLSAEEIMILASGGELSSNP
jgi:hypothetical protein